MKVVGEESERLVLQDDLTSFPLSLWPSSFLPGSSRPSFLSPFCRRGGKDAGFGSRGLVLDSQGRGSGCWAGLARHRGSPAHLINRRLTWPAPPATLPCLASL